MWNQNAEYFLYVQLATYNLMLYWQIFEMLKNVIPI